MQKGTKGQKRCVVKVREVVLKMGERILVQEILFVGEYKEICIICGSCLEVDYSV